jgi:uroporphyrinogen decarboxylase
MLTERENYIRNATFQNPQWIPMQVHISNASWDQYREDMEKVALRHPVFFPYVRKGWRDYDRFDFGPAYRRGQPFTDAWGCTWLTAVNGIEGVVQNTPLEDWEDLDDYAFPDPYTQGDRELRDWESERRKMEANRAAGRLTVGSVPHGFLFMRILYLRGFENAMLDFALGEPRLQALIDQLVAHNRVIVDQYLGMGVDVMCFGDDLGTQTSTFLSPSDFGRWIAPAYRQLMEPCKKAGVLVALHSDGCTLDILEDQIAAGVDIVNPQDLCNGIDNLAKRIKGKACIQLDIDRQKILPYGARREIHELIEEEVRKLGDPRGGLEFIAGIYPPTPPENVDALCEALEKFRTYWWN